MERKVDFYSLTRRQLQTLCKQYKIPANMTNVAMAGALDDLLNKVDGCEVNVAELLVTPCKAAPDTPLVTPGRLTRSQVKKQLQESATKREPQQKKLLFDSEAVSVKNDESVKAVPKSTKKPPVRRSVVEVKDKEQQKLSEISAGEGSVVCSGSFARTAKSSQVRRIAIADEKNTEEVFKSEVFSCVSSGDGWEISKVQVVSSEVTVADERDDKVEVAEKESKISVSAVESTDEDGAKSAAVPVVADVIPDEHVESEASAKSVLEVEDGESEASAKASPLVAEVIPEESGASAKVCPVPVAAVIPEEDGESEASAKVASVPVIILEEDGELEASAKDAPVPMVAEVIVEECGESEASANASPVPMVSEGIPGASNEDELDNASGSGELAAEDRVPEMDAESQKVTGMGGAEDDEQSEESEYSPEDGYSTESDDGESGQDMEGGSEYEGSESDDEDHIPSCDEAVADFNTKLNEDLVPDDECEKMGGVDGEQKEASEYTSEDGYSTEVESDDGESGQNVESESEYEGSESDDEDDIKSQSDEEDGLMKEMHSDQECEVRNEEDGTSVLAGPQKEDCLTSAEEVYNHQPNDIVEGAEDGLAEAGYVKSTEEALLTVISSGEDAKTSLAVAGFLDDQLVLPARAQVSDLAADAWDEADDIYFVEDQYRDETKEADPAFVLEVEQLSQALSEVSICDDTEVAEVQNQNEQEKEAVVDDKSMKRAEDDDRPAVEAEVADEKIVATESELQPPSSEDVEVVNEEAKVEDDHRVIVNELPEAGASLEVAEEIREAVARIDTSASNPSKKNAAKTGWDKENLVGFGKLSLRQLKKIHKTKLELRKEKAPSARARLQESSKSAVLSPNVRKNNCAH